ncbi:hypothetical protein [Alteribacillus sp. HJP-4]|uniref:hypothetical protein n=1 Tax=Alteribacillus sp. HJP-4 TaxID=2775394 RepID=UPI0035CCDFFA
MKLLAFLTGTLAVLVQPFSTEEAFAESSDDQEIKNQMEEIADENDLELTEESELPEDLPKLEFESIEEF